jgi:hypothetical protein
MHPEQLRALAHAHHRELLQENGFWDENTEIPHHGFRVVGPQPRRPRQGAGRVLVLAGTRLMGPERARLTLAHD